MQRDSGPPALPWAHGTTTEIHNNEISGTCTENMRRLARLSREEQDRWIEAIERKHNRRLPDEYKDLLRSMWRLALPEEERGPS